MSKKTLFEEFEYKLYYRILAVSCIMERIKDFKLKSEHATQELFTHYLATSERDQLIWCFENNTDYILTNYHKLLENWDSGSIVCYKEVGLFSYDNIEIMVDISGYDHIMEYLMKLDKLYKGFIDKYEPPPEHYEQSETVDIFDFSLERTLENYLSYHNKYLDIIEMYGKNWG